jgi:hypothetical protein
MSMLVGSMVSFGDWDDRTGEEIVITGKVESEFTDPEDRNPRPSLHVRTVSGHVFTPYAADCRPATQDEMDAALHCINGLHSWVDAVGKLPAYARCQRCGAFYAEPK